MNNTNRALNRLGLLLLGLVLLAIGSAAAVAAANPDWFERWQSLATTVETASNDVVAATTLDGLGQSWLLILIPVLALLLIVLLLAFAFRQGQGHARALVTEKVTPNTEQPSTGGSIVVEGKVAEQAIRQALDSHPEIVSSSVSTYLVAKTPALRITTQVRRGASPQVVRAYIDETVTAWDGLLGREVPVLIQINGGFATRTAKASRVSTPSIHP